MFEEIFHKRKIILEKLLNYGFTPAGESYQYFTEIFDGEFVLKIIIDADGNADTFLTEKASGEEYILYKTNASGAYIGEVRQAISDILQDISDKCYQSSVFKQPQTLRLIDYASAKYGDEPEFLWEKLSDYAVLRRKDTEKWYAVVLTVPKCKLGFSSDERVEILDLRIPPEQMNGLMNQPGYYPGWHMNKKNWFTVILDNSIGDELLFERLHTSYTLAR